MGVRGPLTPICQLFLSIEHGNSDGSVPARAPPSIHLKRCQILRLGDSKSAMALEHTRRLQTSPRKRDAFG